MADALSDQSINIIAVVALLIVISHATFTTSNERLARYSGVLSDLSLALLAAWIFNLLVVEIPRRRDRVQLYSGIAWMIGLMAKSGLSMMEHLSHAANENINIDSQVGGVIIAANREVTDRICSAIGPRTPYVPIPGAIGCWDLIRNSIEEAREYHSKLQPWLPAFDVEVSAAMNAVILSQLSHLQDTYRQLGAQLGGATLANLSEQVYEHWKACDELMTVYYSEVQPYVTARSRSRRMRNRKSFTPEKNKERAIADAHKAMAEQQRRCNTSDDAGLDRPGPAAVSREPGLIRTGSTPAEPVADTR